jgi:uncharacterized membrane protein YbhN (UPF0104 family)
MPIADLASSSERFFNAAAEFFRHLSEIHWTSFFLALLCLLAMQLARAWAWRNVLRAAYPDKRIDYVPLAAAYLAGAGINAVIPAHAGDVTKVFPELPELPAFDISFWANHPKTLAITVGVLLLAIVVGIYYLAHRVRRFWARVKQGLVILTQPRRYMREVFAWQGIGWLFRFASFWLFLQAFGIPGTVANVMLVMSVQAIANIIPFTPGGAGAQQALLVATLHGPTRAAVLSFSVGTQIAMAAWSIVTGFAAIILVFRTTDWRGLIRQAQEEADCEEEASGGEGAKHKPQPAGSP